MLRLIAGLLLLSIGCAQAQTPGKPTYAGVASDQFALAVTTNTQLTVPVLAICAYITVEGASVRRTSDGSSASTTNGTLFAAGTQWADCGPLVAYKFTAVSGSPTLDVEYFK